MLAALQLSAHPTGNMIAVGDYLLWPYVAPLQDPQHHACLMIWHRDSTPRLLLQSGFAASDYLLSSRDEDIYLIERRHTGGHFEARVLTFKVGEKPRVIWDWFVDSWRVGEGGFFMKSEAEIVFCTYPGVYILKKGGVPQSYLQAGIPLKRLRKLAHGRLLLLGENSCLLTNEQGRVLHQWQNLTDEQVEDAPLGRNQVFDVDYHHGSLLIAYWGKRSFEVIDSLGQRRRLLQLAAPLAPHWVAFFGSEYMLFASALSFEGSNPLPHLLGLSEKGTRPVWVEK
ncbi:MAG: hypothetical protein D6730_02155 [Bacteroidetes bacterium]|nr:MAG: hypothetical protein D6730_02155 [Bacteroidota bacterium]